MDPTNGLGYNSTMTMLDALICNLGIPPDLMKGGNYSSSRVALDMFELEHGIDKIPTSGGSWIGDVQSP